MRIAWVLGIAMVGCYSPSPVPGSPCSSQGTCPAGLECRNNVCELPAGGDAASDAPIDVPVDACANLTCDGPTLIACGERFACEQGCNLEPVAHCRALRPVNGLTVDLLAGATADVADETWTFDTDTGRIWFGSDELRPAGIGVRGGIQFQIVDDVGVFAANSFVLGTSHRWRGDGSHPLALFAATSITIAGELDGTAAFAEPGPGGTPGTGSTSLAMPCAGRAGRFLSSQRGEGGGGAGGSAAGGTGGASNGGASTGVGGASCTERSTTTPLRGGAGGGHGAATSENAGGGGGGAIALVAMASITITPSGVVSVSGGGGTSGPVASPSGEAGGGGGAGGGLLLEAPTVTVRGALTANGGSGASPSVVDGQDGSKTSSTPVAGGQINSASGTVSGGRGGAGTSGATNGGTFLNDDGLGTPTSVTARGAGGGGATGRIQIRASNRTLDNAVVSPTALFDAPDYE
jgi:hypothetical protein